MRRLILKNAAWIFSRNLHYSSPKTLNPYASSPLAVASTWFKLRLYSSESGLPPLEKPDPVPESSVLAQLQKEDDSVEEVKDVGTKELKEMMDDYFKKGDEDLLPSIMETILQRRMSRKHEESDEELIEELRMKPLDNVNDEDFEEDFEGLHETDDEIEDLYDTRTFVVNKMMDDEFFNMDDKKWDDMITEAMDAGFIKDTRECEEILEDMLNWDKLLPDDLKQKVEKKFNELGDMCESGQLEPEEAYEIFKQFEDEMVKEYVKKMEAEGPPQFDETVVPDKKCLDDPPGEGPILRWQTRVVFAPGGNAWHPKNRKVKLSVSVKELGLSKYQFKRLRELVGKRYHPGRDQLTITSERFEHREENRKDCLRTLFSLIEEAGKANKLAEDARVSFVKDRLRANPAFMERLRAKTMRRGSNTISA